MPGRLETVALTLIALTAFASNSILTRMALAAHRIDAASFTLVRLGAGALVLALIARGPLRPAPAAEGSPAPAQPPSPRWLGPLALFAYAAPFSFAYLRIGAALGALVLFGAVQLTMIAWGISRGERPGLLTWTGIAFASAGLAALMLPAAARPDLPAMALMALAGIAWGVYSLAGRRTRSPLAENGRSFLLSTPAAALLELLLHRTVGGSPRGLALALVSGGITSALGYAIWYRALRGLTATQAAVVQLSVPVIAALGAVALLGEPLGTRLVICGAAVLGGVALALAARMRGAG